MLRITGGLLGGRRIAAPSGISVRPTQERVREAFFAILAERIPGCSFLDLFAGSGIIGLEALSRGAAKVTMVERDARVCAAIKRVLDRLCPADAHLGQVAIVNDDVTRCLGSIAKGKTHGEFDLVYSDPPYGTGDDGLWQRSLAAMLVAARLPSDGGFWIMEHRTGRQVPDLPDWTVVEERMYGGTGLTFYRMKTP